MPVLSPSLILSAVMPVALLLGLGFVLRKRAVIDDPFRAGLLSMVLKVFFPALILAKVSVNPMLRDNAVALWAPLTGFLSSVIGFAVARLFARFCGAETTERARAFAYTTGHYNYGYLALSICGAIYGPGAVAILLLFNTGVEFSFWTIGIMTLTGGALKDAWKRVLNPITFAMIAAFILNRTGAGGHLPDWSLNFLEAVGACSIPCGLMLIGMGLPALFEGFRAHHDAKISIGAILLRNGVIPACFVGIALAAPHLPGAPMPAMISKLLFLQAAMPAGVTPILMCQFYGVAPQVSLRVVVATTLASVVTLPAWLWAGAQF